MTLDEYRKECGWSMLEMAKRAKIDFGTLKRAITGEAITAKSAKAITTLLSSELKRPISIRDLEGLNVK